MPSSLPPESSLSAQEPWLRQHYAQAREALERGNAAYAREWCRAWLEHYPHVPEFRMLLREAQLELRFPDRGYARAGSHPWRWVPGWPWIRDASRLLEWCERQLDRNPLDPHANLRLAEVARRLDWVQTEEHALQTLLLSPWRDLVPVLRLAQLLLSQDRYAEAAELCETVLLSFPGNPELEAMREQIALRESMQMVPGASQSGTLENGSP